MRIAVDVQPLLSNNLTGIGYYQVNLLKEILKSDKQNEYILNFFSVRHTEEKKLRLKKMFGEDVKIKSVRYISYSIMHKVWLILPIPYKWLFHQKADVTLFFNYYVPPFPEGQTYSFVYDTVIKDMPETMAKRTRRSLKLTLKRSIKRADKIITISQFSKQRIICNYNVSNNKIFVIPCGIDHSLFAPIYAFSQIEKCKKKYGINTKYILYLGTLEPRKNISGLVKAYALLLKCFKSCPKLVIGGGKGWNYDDIFDLVKQLNIENNVIYTGYVNDKDIPLLMSGAELFCFPSFYEGFGMPPVEAMACGTPTIVSNTSSLPEVVGNGAITVNPYSYENICESMFEILTDEQERQRLKNRGIEIAKKYDWETSSIELLNILNQT